jgi:hypothetical protein
MNKELENNGILGKSEKDFFGPLSHHSIIPSFQWFGLPFIVLGAGDAYSYR